MLLDSRGERLMPVSLRRGDSLRCMQYDDDFERLNLYTACHRFNLLFGRYRFRIVVPRRGQLGRWSPVKLESSFRFRHEEAIAAPRGSGFAI